VMSPDLDPHKGDLWSDLATSYLLQVENDARVMTSAHSDSPCVKLRAAEVLAEEGKRWVGHNRQPPLG